MTKFFTVYFDTQFYVRLANVDEKTAKHLIERINELQIRHVISSPIIFELLKKTHKPLEDRQLVERLKRFKISPYIPNSITNEETSNLPWNVLLLKGEERKNLADYLCMIRDLQTKAESWSICADKDSLNAENKQQLLLQSLQDLKKLGLTEEADNYSSEELLKIGAKLYSKMLLPISNLFPEETKVKMNQINFDIENNEENALKISEQLLEALGNEVVNSIETQSDLQKSATISESRPYKVAVGKSSEKEKRGLGRTLTDTEHMLLFIENAKQIDFLQVDKPQLNIIQQKTPIHKLVKLNLSDRCFAASELDETIEKVGVLKENFFNKKCAE